MEQTTVRTKPFENPDAACGNGSNKVQESSSGDAVAWELISCDAGWQSRDIEIAWSRLLTESAAPNALYRSPEWLGHLHSTFPKASCFVAVSRQASGVIEGIVPLRYDSHVLTFDIAGRRLAGVSLRTLRILGSLPLCPEQEVAYDRLFEFLAKSFPECAGFTFNCVFQDLFLWNYLNGPALSKNGLRNLISAPATTYISLVLPENYELLLAQFDKKKRYNLRRQEKLLREEGKDGFAFHRIESAQDVPLFMRALKTLVDNSGYSEPEDSAKDLAKLEVDLMDLGDRGLLRSYAIVFGDVPVALMLAYRYRQTLQVQWTRFNKTFEQLSPGTTLFQMVLKDLFETGHIKDVELGQCESKVSHYKSFSYILRESASCLVLRRTFRNRAMLFSRSVFQSGKKWISKFADRFRRQR